MEKPLGIGTYHTRRTGHKNDGKIWTYWLEIAEGDEKGRFITIQTYRPIHIEALQEVAITIE